MPRVLRGAAAFIPGSNAEVRLLRSEFQTVTVQVCINRRCLEARIDPKSLYHALFSIAADVLGEDIGDLLHKVLEALRRQIMVDNAVFNQALQKPGIRHEELEAAAARLVKHWELYKMMNDVVALYEEWRTKKPCSDGDCVAAAKEISRTIQEELGAPLFQHIKRHVKGHVKSRGQN